MRELLTAKNLLPGPMRALMASVTGEGATSNLGAVVKFLTRQFPSPAAEAAPVTATVRTSGRAGRLTMSVPDSDKYDGVLAAMREQQQAILRGELVVH